MFAVSVAEIEVLRNVGKLAMSQTRRRLRYATKKAEELGELLRIHDSHVKFKREKESRPSCSLWLFPASLSLL
jgi:hypothetical protein